MNQKAVQLGSMVGPIDWGVIILYFICIFGIAFWAYFQQEGEEDSSTYFLAGRNTGWFVIGASLFASNIGSEHLVGLAGTGADSGLAVGQFEILASWILLILGWVFVPFYLQSGVFTMPEWLERRYSEGARWYLALVSILGYVLTKVSVTIFAGALVFEKLLGIPFWTGALVVVLATGIYTIAGGLTAVLYTDLLQMFVLIFGAVSVTVLGMIEVGGWAELTQTVGSGFFELWKPMSHSDFPWTGIVFGAPILGVWYWCTDQFIVQRCLSGKNVDEARRGTIFGGFLKLLPLFIFVLPGVIAFALQQKGMLTLNNPDQALPAMIGSLLPVGMKGLVVAGLLAALMSSLSSIFNSCSTLITWDIYQKFRPEASEKELVSVGRISTVFIVVLGIAWIPMMDYISDTLYKYIQSVQAYISPPIAAVFLIGLFSRRVNASGALVSLFSGLALGSGRIVAEIYVNQLAEGSLLHLFATVNFLHFAVYLFLFCTAVLYAVSLLTQPQSDVQLKNVTFATLDEERQKSDQTDPFRKRMDIALSLLLILLITIIWIYFSPLRTTIQNLFW